MAGESRDAGRGASAGAAEAHGEGGSADLLPARRSDEPGTSRVFDELLSDAVHEPALLIPGTTLAQGRFVVRTLVGTGGMGAVYRATDTRRGLEVAVKVLSRVEAAGIYALKREFRSLSTVRHPNLVALHELHGDRGTWFFTMDLVAGKPLSQVRWTPASVREAFGQVAEALQAIHLQGKLHRDLKPSNVMLTPAGRVVVLDFGLVSDEEPGGAGRTLADDALAGTPAYMAPEQATGRASRQSDWYAFGTMLYEALFGRPPFEDKGVAVLVRKREEPASPPPSPAGEVPEDLEDLCLRLLEREAARRPGYSEVVAVLGTPGAAGAPGEDRGEDPFVGREAELHALERALLETDRGRSAVVAVSGRPGIGKTRLVRRFLEVVRQDLGGVVLSGRCPKWEHVPFPACDSLVDDLSRYLRALPTERATAVLPRTTHALVQVFPVLGRLEAVRSIKRRRAPSRGPAEVLRLGLAALRELLGNIAAQDRLVVFVDDLQWSDLDGARLLASLVAEAAEPDGPAMLLVVAHRTVEGAEAPGLSTFLERVASSPDLRVEHLSLRELSEAESRELAGRLLGGARRGLEERIAREASGDPLFIRQLVWHVRESSAEPGPVDLDGVLAMRLAALSPGERETLAAICLTPRPVTLGFLSEVTDRSDPEPTVRRLESAQLVRFVSGPSDAVTAFHDRIRDAVVSATGADQRSRLHSRSVEALEREAEPDLVALTLHHLGCGREEDAAAVALRAARSAASALAFEQAAAMYRLALDLGRWQDPERVDLVLRLAEALVQDRRSAEAGTAFLEAASLEDDAERRRGLRLQAADKYLAAGWLREGVGLLREVFEELGLDYDGIAGADLVELRRRLGERGLEVVPRAEGEVPPETLARLEALSVAGNGLAWIKPQSVPFRFALALEALEAGAPVHFAAGLKTVARVEAQLDPDDERTYAVVRRLCDEHPGDQAELIRPSLEAGMAFVRGRPWDQDEAGRRTEELLLRRPTQDARLLAVARYHQALALHLQGEVHEIRRRCRGWLQDAEDRKDLFLGSWLNVILAGERLARDRPETARAMCEKAVRMRAALEEDSGLTITLCTGWVLAGCDAYEGLDSAWDRLRAATSWIEGPILDRSPFLLCDCHTMWGRAALACAQLEPPGGSRREDLLREVEASAEVLAGPPGKDGRAIVLPHHRNVSFLLRAGLAAVRGDPPSALAHLDRGLARMSEAGSYSVLSAHARRAKGVLLGGAEGAELVARAEAQLERRGIEEPGRHARAVLPGFPS